MNEEQKKEEIKKLAQILHREIYNANIRVYEKAAYEGIEYYSKILNEIDYSVLDIERAIFYGEDLNHLNDQEMEEYINIDLNKFLKRIVYIRENGVQYYIHVIETEDIEVYVFGLEQILECFTDEEGLLIKKAFLKRMLNFCDIEQMEMSVINNLFFMILNEIKNQQDNVILRNLVTVQS